MEDTLRIPGAEAARRLDVTPRTVRRRVDAGQLAGELIGGRLWVEVPFRRGQPRVTAEPSVPSIATGEAASRPGTSRHTVHRLVEEGRLSGEWIGGRLWVAEHSVAALERRGWR